ALIATLAAAGCAGRPGLREYGLSTERVELDTPFHPQSRYQCGTAALATVLGASGLSVTPVELSPRIFLTGGAEAFRQKSLPRLVPMAEYPMF
ncbi:MAG: hypothetical protein O2868_17640, partial [Proteobacteria bacterium]|nr:hypothetical protein [Pseudomonadota bacterium]